MKKQYKPIVRGLIGAGLIGSIHYVLHSYASLEFINVGYWLVGVLFVYLVFIEDKLLKVIK